MRMSTLGQKRSLSPNVRFAPLADIPFRLFLVTRGTTIRLRQINGMSLQHARLDQGPIEETFANGLAGAEIISRRHQRP